jgi:uncharacterized membrane protein YbhN (UPF0104 family)
VVALWWFVRGIDMRALGDTFERAAPWPLVLAVLLNGAAQHVRALGWHIMLGPRYRIPFGRLVRYEFSAQAASAITPARAGEVVRVWLLKSRDDVPASTTGALIAVKKLLEAIGLAILVLPVPWLLPGLPMWVGNLIILFAAIMGTLLALLAVAARRAKSDMPPTIIRRLVGGMHFLRDWRRMLAALAVAVVGEAADLAAVFAVLVALDIDLPIAAAALILFMIDISNLMPTGPAHVGTFEVGAFSALELLPVQHEAALAFALLFHAQQVLPQIVVGLPLELRLLLGRQRSGDFAEPSEGSDHGGSIQKELTG